MTRSLTMLVLAVAMCGAGAGGAGAEQPQRSLSVVGTGTATAAPDLARLGLGVTVRNESAQAAFAEAARVMAAVLEAIDAAGVAAADVRTTELRLSPVYASYETRRITAYSASHRVQATVRDLGGVGALLDAAARAGATDVDEIAFDVADRASLLDAARAAAVADAARTAAVLSEAAAVSLGQPLDIAMHGAASPGRALRAASFSDAETVLAPGTISVSASVSVIYALK